jgi:hypothetical protein
MNTTLKSGMTALFATLAAATTGLALAEGPMPDDTVQPAWTSTLARADVVAELLAFKEATLFAVVNGSSEATPDAAQATPRPIVAAARNEGRESGEIVAMTGEDSGAVWLEQHHHEQVAKAGAQKVAGR